MAKSMLAELQEFESLSQLVSRFADAMRARLWQKMREGYKGWNDETDSEEILEANRDRLSTAVAKYLSGDREQITDIANLAAILWLHETKPSERETLPPSPPAAS